jgi:hypothetical protein
VNDSRIARASGFEKLSRENNSGGETINVHSHRYTVL